MDDVVKMFHPSQQGSRHTAERQLPHRRVLRGQQRRENPIGDPPVIFNLQAGIPPRA